MTGKQLRKYRLSLGLTLKAFGRMVGYSENLIAKIEAGDRKVSKVLAKLIECQQSSKCYLKKEVKKAQVKPRP